MPEPTWHQANVAFANWADAQTTALARVTPLLLEAEDAGAVTAWFYVRKNPCWRIRYQPHPDSADRINEHLDALTARLHIAGWTQTVYEPEVHAFGGPEAMAAAHRLFHQDSRNLATHLPDGARQHRRELSLLLCSLLMRSAGLDWYEQGDVWARVTAHRGDAPATTPEGQDRLNAAVHRMISVTGEDLVRPGERLAYAADWAHAYTTAGTDLSHLTASGHLHRGLREVTAHHILFAWNRAGLPYTTQAALAAAAKTAVFGPDPTTGREPHDRADSH
ncbi:methyltransferase [Streptomyces sp. XY413]|uniref:thiopeptide-type bacteriocin biosynthesis protein n=1 Tax=Streptomyces sp. XY413 TaxID=1519479 RepID=UPI0006B001F1|nr:thiopeptide-type bacteriocin biosynthesis protein [Streptomyces sp. XY413]KOV22527.1 methyltransferase [Streptomyces sp. XY413]